MRQNEASSYTTFYENILAGEMRQVILLAGLVLCMTYSEIKAQTMDAFDTIWQGVVRDYQSMLQERGVVGSSLMFLHDGEVIGQALYGMADLETQRRVDEYTIYHWASNTKTLTGIAIMQLRDRGLISLEDPIVDYLPELKLIHNPHGDIHEITIRHAMSHSAGFRSPTWPWGGDKSWHPHEPTTWNQLVTMMPYTEILFEPGSRYSYSNPAIIFLGRIIEQISGDDYEVYVDKNILKPLRMYNTYFDLTPFHLLPYRSNNYSVRDGKPIANGLDFDTGITVSNGGLNAPLVDMVKYLSFLMGNGDRMDIYDIILRRSSLEEMWQVEQEVGEEDGIQSAMALTYFVLEKDGRRFIGHTGSQKAFLSFFYVHPESKTACIAAFNSEGVYVDGVATEPDTRAILARLRELLFDSVFPLFTVDP